MRIEQLSFKFDAQQRAYFFNNISIAFALHQLNFITGDNGVGKSTLFSILQGHHDVHSYVEGRFLIDGAECDATMRTQYVHTVQQKYDQMIADQFTFMQNLQFANMGRYPGLNRLANATVFPIIEQCAIDMHKPVHLLSGGQRQLLAIVMALQKTTRVLLLDEPTATLDAKNAQLIMQCLEVLARELSITIIIICHDRTLMGRYGTHNQYVMSARCNGERVITRSNP